MNKNMYPAVFLLIIAIAVYFMYGNAFSPSQVDLSKYNEVCQSYQSASAGEVSKDQLQMLISEVNYLVPESSTELADSEKKKLKDCVNELAKMLNKTAK